MNALAKRLDHGVTRWSKIGALLLLGWLGSSWWYGTGSFHQVEKAIPALQAEAGCEHWRADTAAKLALSPEMVTPSQIPKDCAHVPPVALPAAK